MVGYADTSFLASLYLPEPHSPAAIAAMNAFGQPLPLTALISLELRNAFNLSVHRQRITVPQREALWQAVETDLANGVLVAAQVDYPKAIHSAARMSAQHTPNLGTRSLDLIHVASAGELGAKYFFSFDERQRKAALGEGFKVKP